MSDINLTQVEEFVARYGTSQKLIEAAAAVANAIHIGAGGMIKGSLMEQELRDALLLKRGELVNIRQGTRSVTTKGE
jgi:TctA family transporter